MRNFLLLLLLLIMVHGSHSQEQSEYYSSRTAISSFKKVEGNFTNAKRIAGFLLQSKGWGSTSTHLKLLHFKESPAAYHYQFRQLVKDIPVYGGTYKVNTDKKGNIISRFDNTIAGIHAEEKHFPEKNIAFEYLSRNDIDTSELASVNSEEVWFSSGEELIPSLSVQILVSSESFYEVVLDAEGNELYRNNLAPYYHQMQDSTVSGKVFSPDPITSANTTYSGNYTDNNDADNTSLNNERQTVTFTANYTGSDFTLENSYIKITEHSSPSTGSTVSNSPSFDFTRSQAGFEDVNVFYHISYYQNHIQNLGFSNIVNYQIHADAHGFNGLDNSNFNPGFSPPRLTFGEGGVDDGEDADVIIHEYGHAISNSAAPGTNSGNERKTLDEAIGDYFAASYSRYLNSYYWQKVYSWDGHNEFWNGRWATTSKCYNSSLDFSNIYEHADIFSSTLMQIWFYIGRDTTDKITIQSLYSYASNMSMVDAANLFIQADSLLYGGNHYDRIHDLFENRGILGTCNVGISERVKQREAVKLKNSAGFMSGEDAAVKFPEMQKHVRIELIDLRGRVISNNEFSYRYEVNVRGKHLKPGAYLLKVYSDDQQEHQFKLVRQ